MYLLRYEEQDEHPVLQKFGDFFMKALEIRRKYPNARFWFSLEVL